MFQGFSEVTVQPDLIGTGYFLRAILTKKNVKFCFKCRLLLLHKCIMYTVYNVHCIICFVCIFMQSEEYFLDKLQIQSFT